VQLAARAACVGLAFLHCINNLPFFPPFLRPAFFIIFMIDIENSLMFYSLSRTCALVIFLSHALKKKSYLLVFVRILDLHFEMLSVSTVFFFFFTVYYGSFQQQLL